MSNNLIIISLFLSVLSIILAVISILLNKKVSIWQKIFTNADRPDNLEEIIDKIAQNIKLQKDNQTIQGEQINRNEQTLQNAFQNMGLSRFNSGSDDGGNLSFSLALVNNHNSGIIITSLHGRQYNRIYCKEITNGQVNQALSQEEELALKQALNN